MPATTSWKTKPVAASRGWWAVGGDQWVEQVGQVVKWPGSNKATPYPAECVEALWRGNEM